MQRSDEPVVKGTFILELSNMLGTPNLAEAACRLFFSSTLDTTTVLIENANFSLQNNQSCARRTS